MLSPALLCEHWILALLVCFVENCVKDFELVTIGLGEVEVDLEVVRWRS